MTAILCEEGFMPASIRIFEVSGTVIISCNHFNFESIAKIVQNYLFSKFIRCKTFEKFTNYVNIISLSLIISVLIVVVEMRRGNVPPCSFQVCRLQL